MFPDSNTLSHFASVSLSTAPRSHLVKKAFEEEEFIIAVASFAGQLIMYFCSHIISLSH